MTGSEHHHRAFQAHAPHGAHAAHHHHGQRVHPRAHPARQGWGQGLRRAVGQATHFTVHLIRRRWVRRTLWSSGAILALVAVGMLGLWWRLSQGPIELDMVTPWLKAAIEDNFGGKRTVTVGGTQIERDENGRTSLRIRDIVVRDADGTVVASAPKAEVGLSGLDLLRGQVRAQSLNLVGAEMAVRIESDGRVTVFAGADARPIASAAAPAAVPAEVKAATEAAPQGALRSGLESFAGVLAWIDGLGATGLDGHDLRELGLKSGNLIVDDRRNGKRWTFDHINVTLQRPHRGGVLFQLQSENPQRPWMISAAMRPLASGVRAVGIEARQVSIRDILLALRVKNGEFEADLPLSASIRAEIAADGTPQVVHGQLIAGTGVVTDHTADGDVVIPVDHADVRFSWDARRRALMMPFQLVAAGNQFTLRADLLAPNDDSGVWQFAVSRGDSVIDPIILASSGPNDEGIALNHVNLRLRIDTLRKRVDIDQGDLGRIDTRPSYNVGLAITGSVDYTKADPHIAFGVAGTRMPMAVMTRLWPSVTAGHLRKWIMKHVSAGTVERIVVAGNGPLSVFQSGGPPTPDDGLSVDMESSATTLRPIADLPAIRDADVTVRITGRTATVNLGRGTVDVAPGRRLNIASGLFQIADTHRKPQMAHTQFRIDGGVPAAAVLLASDALRDDAAIPLDPDSSRGTIAAQVSLDMPLGRDAPPGSVRYTIGADLSSFSADKLLMGQKLEASSLHVVATNLGYQVKGEVKLGGTSATIELNRQKKDPDGALSLQANLDEAARKRLGINLGTAIIGVIPIKISGRVGGDAKEERLGLDADLTAIAVDDLLPGWEKPAGKPAHLTATLIRGANSMRFDNLVIVGSGANVKGSIEVDNAGDVTAANFSTFALSEGDKLSLKADRGNDGALRVTMRGDVFDGRKFVKSALAGHSADKVKKQIDLDLDVKIGAVAGHNGEVLRGLDLRLTRRAGHIRTFALNAKIGRDTQLLGDLRLRANDNHQVIYFETNDAGALFRFTDMYPRMYGGKIWVAMDPPTQDRAPQIGHLYISNFVVRGEATLDRLVAGAPGQPRGGVQFTELRSDFTRAPGTTTVREGVVRGPLVGATIEGHIDYLRDNMHLTGTFVPFYGINNIFGQIPIVGMILGAGSNEGLVGIAYEANGPPSAPRVTVNLATAVAPGVLRKFIPNPSAFEPNAYQPER